MKRKLLATLMALLAFISCKHEPPIIAGCMDASATNYNANANSSCTSCCTFQGGVLFYITDPSVLGRCGPVTITLSNGQSTIITGFYNGAPANCINVVGGFMLVGTGTYSYTISSGGCGLAYGSITVVAGCNRFLI